MKFVRRALPTLVLVLLLVASSVFFVRREEVFDWAAARGYEPAPTVAQLVTDTTMTPYATRLFFANRPAVEGKETFNKHCTDPSEQVAVLGCFTGNRRGIYLYDVTDARLNGIEQVTAAHEMLHQAYQRLTGVEKTRINGLLQEYHDLKASQALKDKIASYKSTEPNELLNEMHSIFGTEASDLPNELDSYYKQYFGNRQQILVFHQQYQSEFDLRIAQIADYDSRLEALKPQIEAKKSDLETQEKVLSSRRAQLDAYLASNQVAQYNAAVPGFNSLVFTYREGLKATNALVDEFNRLLEERNQLAVQERQLEAAIDSSLDTAPKQ
jgi:hypothetical protein